MKGFFAAEDVLQKIHMTFDHWDGHLAEEALLRQDREKKERARLEEEQRALEMQSVDRERLRQHEAREEERRARERERRREEERRERERKEAEEAQREREEAEERRRVQLQRERAAAQARLPPEPSSDAAASTVACISLKSTSGTQYQRRFFYTDKLSCLRDYAMTLDEYNGSDFQLVAGYPPRPLELDGNKTFGEVPTLLPRAVVLMRNV